jgi:hypothetical protein
MSLPPLHGVPPATGNLPAPSPRSRKRALIWVIGAVLLLGSIAAGISIWGGTNLGDSLQMANIEAGGHMSQLERGDFGHAYDAMCAASRQRVTRQEFIAAERAKSPVVSSATTGTTVDTHDGVRTGSVTVYVAREDGTDGTVVLEMVEEEGVWKVCPTG